MGHKGILKKSVRTYCAEVNSMTCPEIAMRIIM